MEWKRAFFNMQKFEPPENKRIEPHSYCEEEGMRRKNYREFKKKVQREGLQGNPLDYFLTFGEGFGNFDTEGQGKISIQDFEDVYDGIKHEFNQKPGKWFTVVSNNCAHHMSYLLAKYAFRNVKTNTKKIVINFDAHPDCSKGKALGVGDIIRCSNWAQKGLINNIFEKYIHIGVKARSESQMFFDLIPKLYISDFADKYVKLGNLYETAPEKGSNIIQFVNEIKIQGDAAYYITVDLDFMKESYTAYGDGLYTKEEGHKMLESIFTRINKTNLYGVDVTGLPVIRRLDDLEVATESALKDVRKVSGLAQSQA